MKNRRLLLISLLFATIILPFNHWGQGLISQSALDGSDAPEEDSVVLRPYPAARITEAFAVSGNLINQSSKKHFTQEDITTYTSVVDTLVHEIDAFVGDPKIISPEGLGVRDLDQILTRAKVLSSRVDDLQDRLSSTARDLESETKQLMQNRDRWRLTLQRQSNEAATPESRIGRIQQTIHKLDSVRALLQEDIALILEGQDALVDRKFKLEDLMGTTTEKLGVLEKNLLSIDSPGFFQDLSNLGSSDLLSMHVESFKSSLKTDYNIVKTEYLRAMVIAAIFLVLLLAFTIWFRKNYPRMISEEDFTLSEIHKTVIHHPVATSVILVTLMIRLLLYELPQSFFYINIIILSIPLTLFAIRIFGKKIRIWIIILVVFYNLQFFYELAYLPGPLIRIFQMFLCIAELWLFAWLYRMKPFQQEFQNHNLYGTFRALILVFAGLPLLGLIANLVGAFRLAEFFSTVPLAITVVGIAIQVFTRMADSIVFMIVSSRDLQRINFIKEDAKVIHKKIVRLIEIFFWLFYLTVVLQLFMVKDAVFEWGRRLLHEGKKIGNLDFTLANILIFFFVIWLSVFITRIITRILQKDVFARVSTAKGIPDTINLLLRITLITGGFFLAAGAAGMELTNLSIILGAFSVGIGFGLQNIFNNMVSGLILAFERPIKVGDVVQVGELMGTVQSIGLRSSNVKSFDGAEVIVPNGNLISNELINWTKSDSNRRMDIRVGVAYGTDPEKVLKLMEETVKEYPEVWKNPVPTAYFLGFGDSSLDFRLLAWVHLDVRLGTESKIRVDINRRLSEAGIEIPFPQRDLHIRSDATQEKATTQPKPEADDKK